MLRGRGKGKGRGMYNGRSLPSSSCSRVLSSPCCVSSERGRSFSSMGGHSLSSVGGCFHTWAAVFERGQSFSSVGGRF